MIILPRYIALRTGLGIVDCGLLGETAEVLSEAQASERVTEIKRQSDRALMAGQSLVHARLGAEGRSLRKALNFVSTLKDRAA